MRPGRNSSAPKNRFVLQNKRCKTQRARGSRIPVLPVGFTYARAGEEYLKHIEIFEFTHPPLTKLVVTLSMMLFGGLNGLGDTALGWRFLNVVVGALMCGVLYVFAKRLTGSTLFAAIATGMLLFDGFHYVQSRIATPEITVAFFSLTTLYAFYRVWTASAARRANVAPVNAATIRIFVAMLIVGAFAGVGTSADSPCFKNCSGFARNRSTQRCPQK